jgi:pyruvate kinase
MRSLAGPDARIFAKIECVEGLNQLSGIVDAADEIIIDRGDLSREVPIEKIPFLQRRIISTARARGKPCHVATNLLESMVTSKNPTRAEVNDVISTLLMGATGLVLAGETAIGEYPLQCVKMIKRLLAMYMKWTENTSVQEVLNDM